MNEYLKTYINYREKAITFTLDNFDEDEYDDEIHWLEIFELKYISQKIKEDIALMRGFSIELFDENPSEKVQLEAVKNSSINIQFIKNPTEKVQLEAVRKNGHVIEYIENPSEQVQLEALEQYSGAIAYIKNPSERVQLEAVKNWKFATRYIKNPTPKVIELHKQLYLS
jgi:hypothetical protein